MENTTTSPSSSKKNRPGRRRLLAIGVPVAALLVGIGLGSAAAGDGPGRVETREVVKEVEVPVEKIVEKKVEVKQTPKSCRSALDYAEKAQEVSASGFQVSAEMMDAVSRYDVADLEARTAELNTLRPDLESALTSYRQEAADCRGN